MSAAHDAADLLVRSRNLFTGTGPTATHGHVAVSGATITAVGPGDGAEWCGPRTEVVDAGEGLVCAGLHDNHVFLTGTVPDHLAVDLAGTDDPAEAAARLVKAADSHPAPVPVLGSGWRGTGDALAAALGSAPDGRTVVVWDADRALLWQNGTAARRYAILPGPISNEALAPVFADAFTDAGLVREVYGTAQDELFRRGVVSVKDIAFDDYLGALPVLRQMRAEGTLRLRLAFASQPVRRPVDLEFGRRASAECRDPLLQFHGFKLMTDGVWVDGTGHMLGGYPGLPGAGTELPDYEALEEAARRVVEAGFALGLNVDGDGAARWAVTVFERLAAAGHPVGPRHSLSDLSFVDPADAARAGALGLTFEVYPQFLGLFPSAEDCPAEALLGPAGRGLNRFATMARSGVSLSSGTDLPLFWPSLPDAIRAATHRRFTDGSPPDGWCPEEALPAAEVVRAWTVGGARARGTAGRVGTLAPGLRADLAVFSHDLLGASPDELTQVQVTATIAGGEVVHRA
ncbi:amidohydrolase family protein [Streptomyces sp. NPDC047000]|uniref:amidohydrolase n=1 Tax=Streptomyces sp. NPDC047000 TaxID=3155474 RepID=UPI003409D693